jgi:hypothetical protein
LILLILENVYLGMFDGLENVPANHWSAKKRFSGRRLFTKNYHQKFSEDSDQQDSQNEHQKQFSAT